MLRHQIIALLLVIVAAGSAIQAEDCIRPEYFGRSLPYPIYRPNRFAWPASYSVNREEIFELGLNINEAGVVDSIDQIDSLPIRIQQRVADMVDSLRFEPGTRDGRIAPSGIRVKLLVQGAAVLPSVTFPVDSAGRISSPELYFESIAMNGVVLPQLVDFPRYGCYFEQGDTAAPIPTAVVAIDLDSTGAAVAQSVLLSNRLLPDNQIMSAALWSKFTPAVVDGVPRPCRVYLTASCFPLLNHPNYPLAPTDETVRSFFREYQIQLRYDTLGWLLPAMPRQELTRNIVVRTNTVGMAETFSLRLFVDTVGDVRSAGINPFSSQGREFVGRLVKELNFYPAIDFHGRPIPFVGLTHVDVTAAPNVRIEYLW